MVTSVSAIITWAIGVALIVAPIGGAVAVSPAPAGAETVARSTPEATGGPGLIDIGLEFACTAVVPSRVRCWGTNDVGQLGLGSTTAIGDDPDEMGTGLVSTDLGSNLTATAIASGDRFSCALLAGGANGPQVKCWGLNHSGQAGVRLPDIIGDRPGHMGDLLASVPLNPSPIAIAAGGDAACAVLNDGQLKCWGLNGSGRLGPDGGGPRPTSIPLPPGFTPTAVAMGQDHACALSTTGQVVCWGENGNGQLGLGSRTDRGNNSTDLGAGLPPVDLGAGRRATSIAAGRLHTCAILDNGKVKCWGSNGSGGLGLGDRSSRGDDPGEMGSSLPAVDLGAGSTATAIAAGDEHTCAILAGGMVKCWGDGRFGQLGLGDTAKRGDGPGEMGAALPPVDLGAGRTATSIAAGRFDTCAVLDDLSVKCWGTNESGQLGQGHTDVIGNQANEMGLRLPPIDLGAQVIRGDVLDTQTGEPVGGVLVAIVRAADFGVVSTVTAGIDGAFEASVLPGSYRIFLMDTRGVRHSGFGLGTDPVTVALGQTTIVTTFMTLVGRAPGLINGTVRDAETRAPVAGVWAIAVGVDGSPHPATTDEGGRFVIRDLPAGDYRVAFVSARYRTHEWWQDAHDYSTSRTVTVPEAGWVSIDAEITPQP